jgi:hypothetical protein
MDVRHVGRRVFRARSRQPWSSTQYSSRGSLPPGSEVDNPPELTARKLMDDTRLPLEWNERKRTLGFVQPR